MEIAVVDETWADEARGRTLPVRLYLPAGAETAPAIVFSHATGGSREDYAYLGGLWAEHGHVSVHLQHPGSDVDCWRGKAGDALPAMRRAAADPQNAVDRVDDVRFALDQLAAGTLAGRVDPERVGVAGHSFGALTALATAGQGFIGPEGEERCEPDPRVKAVIAMSSPRPHGARPEDLERTFARVTVPCLHLTGTRDDSPLNDTRAIERRIAFDSLRVSDQLLVTLAGGDHGVFTGARRRFEGGPKDPLFHALVRRATLAFWDAHLRADAEAHRWLMEGGLAAHFGAEATVEIRRGPAG